MSSNIRYIMIAKAQLIIMPLQPNIKPLSQASISILKIIAVITDDNLASIKAESETKIKDIFEFLFPKAVIKANIKPSKIREYNKGGVGIFVIK